MDPAEEPEKEVGALVLYPPDVSYGAVMRACPKCGKASPDDRTSNTCPSCGASMEVE